MVLKGGGSMRSQFQTGLCFWYWLWGGGGVGVGQGYKNLCSILFKFSIVFRMILENVCPP